MNRDSKVAAGRLLHRVEERVRDWDIVVQDTLETDSSFLAFGRRGNRPVVLKVLRRPGEEWRCGEVLEAFGGQGMVRVHEHTDGAVLLERLDPATSLTDLALRGRDDEATEVLAEAIQRIAHPPHSLTSAATVQDWGEGFQRYLTRGDKQIPASLVERARHVYQELCATQKDVRLLHGDLHHYNVLFDSRRGWVAVDPKGVVGEIEYEIGASLRNPYERPDLFASPGSVERRLRILSGRSKLDSERALKWGFAQAVLAAIWLVEDGSAVDPTNPFILLADAVQPLLE